ncbi:MAG: polysaccharide biosynthesis C-terminal domain-containing protein [Oscillospiraceae bacterium]
MKKKLMHDTVFLTGSSLLMRSIGLLFQMWLVSRIGAAGVGLYGLVGSVDFLAATLAISGIRFASTRLISEEIGLGRVGGIGRAMKLCFAYSLFFGFSAFAILYFTAEPIGFLWVGDARTVLSLRILSYSMPFIAVSSVMYGYFSASGKIRKASVVLVAEQLVRIGLVVIFIQFSPHDDLEKSCAAVSAGSALSEVFSFFLMLTVFLLDRRHSRETAEPSPRLPSRMLNIALPLALSAYARTALSTLEQLLVPRGLKKAGYSANGALEGYGTIQGMVFPIILFPSCLLTALAELIVPELTAAQVSGKTEEISHIISALIRKCLAFSLFIAVLLFILSETLGKAIYGSADAGAYIKLFSLLVPVMYMDMVIDGCLKGLGQQVWSMGFNILDALTGVLLVCLLLPRFALSGYIAIIFLEELFNFSMSLWRLSRVTKINLFTKKPKKCRE